MKTLLIFITSLILIGCSEPSACSLCQKGNIEKIPNDTIVELETFLDSVFMSSDSKQIKNSDFEAYRISSKNVFNPSFITYLFEQRESGYYIVYEELRQDIGIEKPMRVMDKKEIKIDQFEWKHIQYLFCNFGFWTEDQIVLKEALDGGFIVLQGKFPSTMLKSKA